MDEVLLVLLGILILFGGPILAFIALYKIGGLRSEIFALKLKLQNLEKQAVSATAPDTTIEKPVTPSQEKALDTDKNIQSEPVPTDELSSSPKPSETVTSEPKADAQEPLNERQGEQQAEQEDQQPVAARSIAEAMESYSSEKSPWKSFEEAFTRQWLVWLGSLTVIIGGVFLIKYSIENDLLSPGFRITCGVLFGLALMAGGEWLRRRPIEQAIAALKPNHVPPALTAAGLAITYGSIYAAYGLYDLVPPLIAFILLTIVAIAGLGLSLLQGPLIAAMGMAGAFVIPMLVSTGNSSAWALFSYLSFITASALAVVRYQSWWWLGWMSLTGSVLWQLIWMANVWESGDVYPLALHQILIIGLFIAPRYENFLTSVENLKHPFDFVGKLSPEKILGLSTITSVLALQIVLLSMDNFSTASLIFFFIIAGGLGYSAFKLKHCEALLTAISLVALYVVARYPFPGSIELPETFYVSGQEAGTLINPIIPPELNFYLLLSGFIAIIAAAIGFKGLSKTRTPVYLATLSVTVPLLAFLFVYLRVSALGADLAWSLLALVLSGLSFMAAKQVLPKRSEAGMEPVLGVYALAVLAALGIAFAIAFEKSGLTIALALLLPSAGWIASQVRIPFIRPSILFIAVIVVIRLVALNHFDPIVPREEVEALWLLYSFGIPALAFAGAAYYFKREKDDQLVTILESGALAIGVALVNLEIRYLVNDNNLYAQYYMPLEQSLQSLSWLITGAFLYYRNRLVPRIVSDWGSKILLSMAGFQILLFQSLVFNPVFTNEFVGDLPLFNQLSLAYLIPGLISIIIYREARNQGHKKFMPWIGGIAVWLVFLDLTLEVRRAFHPLAMASGDILNAEGYSYSAAWLVFAGVLLAVGIIRDISKIRHLSLGLVLLVTTKVFLWDMSALSGLYRVASFIGLGLCLIGIGFLYQRFVYPIGSAPSEKSGEEDTVPKPES
ncbi:DUF2339 domain-containing protein [Kiloniella sp. EL199]|uniref:DUF2339 domain-containing protein n=1 Tax=Kiloniella sp. EL199 TaxID=2107581 RepID=UPI000EA11443|nr:DUF2339 domain-containing protein [Kiloniella sp. EL199]